MPVTLPVAVPCVQGTPSLTIARPDVCAYLQDEDDEEGGQGRNGAQQGTPTKVLVMDDSLRLRIDQNVLAALAVLRLRLAAAFSAKVSLSLSKAKAKYRSKYKCSCISMSTKPENYVSWLYTGRPI